MRESWRWFGPNDPVSLAHIRQAGATDVVSALHHIPIGDVWPIEGIRVHQQRIEQCEEAGLSPLRWSVVESIPVHEDIKLGKPGHERYVDAWISSMENLAACGIHTICYNFMPVIDWTRTDLRYRLPSGSYALRFDQHQFAAFDLCILQRENAEADYSPEEISKARATFEAMDSKAREQLTQNIIAGLPGRMTDSYSLENFRQALAEYRGLDKARFRQHLFQFLEKVAPRAEACGVQLAIHPDDPPRDMLGLPRVVCTPDDLHALFRAVPSPANGMTLCVGTYGSRADNDVPQMAKDFAERIYFTHLRGVSRDADEQRSFYEASHLDSDIDMVRVIQNLLSEEKRRVECSQPMPIFMRPDHGHQMMDDLDKQVNPGYSGIGRLKGLAEIRGVIRALEALSS